MAEPTPIIIEGNLTLDAPRALLLERYANWLAVRPELEELPGPEVVCTLTDEVFIGSPYANAGEHDEAVGVFAVALHEGRILNPRWEVAMAYGERYRDEHDVVAWLDTLPHELLHLLDFARRAKQRVPSELSHLDIARLQSAMDSEEAIEEAARRLTSKFVAEHNDLLADRELLEGYSSIEARLGPPDPGTAPWRIQ